MATLSVCVCWPHCFGCPRHPEPERPPAGGTHPLLPVSHLLPSNPRSRVKQRVKSRSLLSLLFFLTSTFNIQHRAFKHAQAISAQLPVAEPAQGAPDTISSVVTLVTQTQSFSQERTSTGLVSLSIPLSYALSRSQSSLLFEGGHSGCEATE